MCYETSTHLQSSPMNSPTSPKPARKTRTKTRKPKFVSLRQELSPETSESSQLTHHQLTLFPLHPENLFEEKEAHEHVNYFFDQEEGAGGAASLNGILGGGGSAPPSSSSSSSSEEESLTYAYGHGEQDSEGARSLERTAMRQKERDVTEEKWVAYSDVVERKRTSEGEYYRAQGLLLKLDYEEILNAWSDKGPLYIEGESTPQTVPDVAQDSTSVHTDVRYIGGNEKQVWNVPEDGSSVIEDGGEGKMAYREARVMRYKEKRQSRLFSKRIRYEVRKINAEKRPRMKGRFVKRKPEA